ncbi:hypothetical protein MBLNU457_5923t2 [Dothideomycetes sp. NU457]
MKRRLSIPTDRAAYQASQSLFDALRTGCEKLEEPLHLLKTARDLSQQIHVQVDKDATKRCIEYSLDSLMQTFGPYEDILTNLANVCSPTPTEPTASTTFKLLHKIKRQLDTIQADAAAIASLPSISTSNATQSTTSPDASKKRKLDMPDRSLDTTTTDPSTSSTSAEAPVPGVEYTDVTAEIEARMQAKELKRKAKKESKKRERESMNSIGSVVEQPSGKKKARVNESIIVDEGEVAKPPQEAKANGHADEVVTVKRKQRRSGSGVPGVEKGAASKPRKRVKTH